MPQLSLCVWDLVCFNSGLLSPEWSLQTSRSCRFRFLSHISNNILSLSIAERSSTSKTLISAIFFNKLLINLIAFWNFCFISSLPHILDALNSTAGMVKVKIKNPSLLMEKPCVLTFSLKYISNYLILILYSPFLDLYAAYFLLSRMWYTQSATRPS